MREMLSNVENGNTELCYFGQDVRTQLEAHGLTVSPLQCASRIAAGGKLPARKTCGRFDPALSMVQCFR